MFKFAHNNLNVLDLERSLKFYKEALNLTEKNRVNCGDFILVYLADKYNSQHRLELTWLADRKEPYNLGDNEFHLAFTTKNFKDAHALHEKMGCIVYENKEMGIYFIEDPDGYWIEILPDDTDF
ncbi:MAG: VOC family protein [Selenomonadaceae bacterium]|nr:VOC family protein [Selenomonadaceae bacterium]